MNRIFLIIFILLLTVSIITHSEKIIDVCLMLLGLYAAIRFRFNGKEIVEQRKKTNNFFKLKYKVTNTNILITQWASLIMGIFFFLVGLVKFLS